MQKINFKNLPDTSTPLNAENLNLMQDNIETAINTIELMGGGDEVGTVKMFSGSTAPQGWLICDGSAISRTEYSELFSAIGTTYGSGNGTTTFNIPNIKGRTVVGLDSNDTDFDTLGKTIGSKTDDLSNAYAKIGRSSAQYTTLQYKAKSGSGTFDRKYGNPAGFDSSSDSITDGTELGGSVSKIQPSIVLNYIIKASATTTTQGQIIDSLSGDSTTDAPSVHAVKEGLNKNSDSYLGFESSAQVITSNDVLIKNMELTLNTTKPNILIIFSIPVKTSGDGSPFIRVYLDGTQKAGYTTNQSGLVIMSYATILTDVPAGQHTISIKASRSNATSITIAEYISKSMSVIEL